MRVKRLVLIENLLLLCVFPTTKSQTGNGQIPGCAKTFTIKTDTIIRSKDSQENGAAFIQEVEGIGLSDCIRFCCSTPYCDVSVYGADTSCYLFACDIANSQKCEFSSHADFESAILSVDTAISQPVDNNGGGGGQQSIFSEQQQLLQQQLQQPQQMNAGQQGMPPMAGNMMMQQNNQMNNDVNRLSVQDYPQYNIINSSQPSWPSPNTNTNSQSPNTKVKTIEECGRWEFSCGSGECIAIYDTCNGIAQCADGSDEDTEYCSEYTSTTKKKPGARLRTTPTPVLAPSNNRSVERENKKTSYPKWLNKLPDAAKSGVDTANLASDDDNQISSETGVIPGYKILDYKDTVIEEIGDKIISSHHSLLSTLAFIFAMALLSFALVVGFKAIRHRTFLYRSSQLLDSPNFMRGARQERRVLLSGDDDYDDLNL